MSDDDPRSPEAIALDDKINAFLLGLVDSLFDVKKLQRLEVLTRNAHAEGATIAHAAQVQAVPSIRAKQGEDDNSTYDSARKMVGWALANIIGHLLGIEVPDELFRPGKLKPTDSAIGTAIATTIFEAMSGGITELAPSDDGAKRFIGMLAHLQVQGWAEGIVIELAGSVGGFLHPIEEVSKLGNELIHSLGLSRLARIAMRPLAQDLIATPLQWKTNKQFRPKLLSEATAIKQFLRGKWDWSDVAEELARQGWSDVRQEALYNDARKFQSIDDLALLVWLGKIDVGTAAQTMRDQGYDDEQATNHFNVRKLQREEAIFNGAVSAAITAYIDGRIDEAKLDDVLSVGVNSPLEHQLVVQAAQLHRAVNAKPLTSAETEAAVLAGVLAYPDYRDALKREGRTDDAIDVLDLLLRLKVQKGVDVRTHAQQQADEKKAAAQQKADAAAAKKAEIDAARQLKAQGPIAELEHAVVVGLIPIDRLVSVLAQQFAGDTVAIYVADVTQKRADYIAQQQKKADAALRADNTGLNVGQLEQAVFDGIIPLATLTTLLQQRGLSAGDVQILTATVQARKADLDSAKQKRAAADRRASNKKLSLGRAETLVQLGHWTMAQYDALLVSLEFDDASRAGLEDLLRTSIAARASGSSLRQQLAGAAPSKALTLEQFRKAVIAGDKTIDDFSAFLMKAGYTSDARAVLLDELAADVAGAQAAQLRRQQGDTTGGAVVINLATASKAARLGIISPAAYHDRLVAGGYSDDDVALEMDLLTAEIAKGKPAQQAAAAAAPSPASKGLTLTALANAVKHGTASLEDYRGAAAASGLSPDAVDTLVADLTDALAVKSDAKSAHDNIAATLATKGVTLTALEDQVRAGTLTVVALEQQLVGYGYSDVEAQLVGSLLEQELAAPEMTP